MSDQMVEMDAIIQLADQWLGTPYCAGQAIKGVGADCAGLILALADGLGIDAPPRTAGLEAALNWPGLIHLKAPTPGAILAFSSVPNGPAEHIGWILGRVAHGGPNSWTILHAHWQKGVVENRLSPWFLTRLVAAVRFEEVSPWPQ